MARDDACWVTRPFDPEFDILYAREVAAAGDDPRRLRKLHARGHLIRIRRGAYALASRWEAADDRLRHVARVLAAAHDAVTPFLVAGRSAAALWDAPIFGSFGRTVEVLDTYRGGGRSEPGVGRSTSAPRHGNPVTRYGVDVTDVPRTAIDLACASPFPEAVAAMDWAISSTNADSVTVGIIRDRLSEIGRRPGARMAWRAADLAISTSGSAGESYARAVVHELGFEAPIAQFDVVDGLGSMYPDFAWPAIRVLAEFDGFAKYADPRFNHGDPVEKVRRERAREARLRALGWTIVRVGWADVKDPARVGRLLASAGVPKRLEFVRRGM